MSVLDLRVEHLAEPLGIGTPTPRLSWRLSTGTQLAYEVEAVHATGRSERVRVDSADTLYQPWPFAPLDSRAAVDLRVRALAEGASEFTAWSAPLRIEVGLLDEADWQVDWVSPSIEAAHDGPRPAHLLRAEFTTVGEVRRARLYATAHGIYDLEVNGIAPTDEVLAPGWSSYGHRLRYRTIDLTPHLAAGRNAIGVHLADGWYRGRLGFNGGLWDVYGGDASVLMQLEIEDESGLRVVPLDWRTAAGPVIATGLYEGERHDARLDAPGWSRPGFDDAEWKPAERIPRSAFGAALEAPTGPPVRVVETIRPTLVSRAADGTMLLDVGQNIAGKIRVTASATAGATLRIRHAEVLEDGELATRPLRSATSVDEYTFAAAGRVTWTPRFTIHGFRYVEISGIPDLDVGDVEALVIHSDMRRTGWFRTDHPLLDRFHENVVWSMRDNFVDLPTDCPQRDERLGWTGDIQVFAPTAAYLYDATGVLQNWLRDLAAEQAAAGSVPNFVPWVECGFPSDPAAVWGDAAVIVPWTLYRRTGDSGILRDQFPSMRAWIDQVFALTEGTGHWNRGFQLGDWLDPAAPPERPGDSKTDPYLVATAYLAHSARLVRETALVLGDEAAADRYGDIADRARAAFRAHYVAPSGRVVSDTVTAIAIAIAFDLLENDAQRAEAGRRLAELVAEGDHLIQTGFAGTPIVCDALAATNHLDVAYHLLMRTESPSWLYAVVMGATTVWERWDSMLPDGSINPGEMTSFNHYALGAVADFLHRVVGGIEELEPGYRRVRIAPRPGGGLRRACARHDSPYGAIASAWERIGGWMHLTVTVPAGVTAEVIPPGGDARPVTVTEGRHELRFAVRPAADDPVRPRRWNIHNPEERREMIETGTLRP
ncbi:Bacterial alpha-L-rhamnosidase [Agromyces sp. CFH 90414]|uniref:alpha-L-rhamnosidase n=1 Tax=Agromyces agglutinans TaxID=2662258 RepID=A0A6I2EYU5_9MICO|nr:family 78 glycoside hydrolase catalytic domain [Agromyces agglutinans]MRG58295.1 Bacterial alpha-L-rhamnosidase [Agromyces agglutinans]